MFASLALLLSCSEDPLPEAPPPFEGERPTAALGAPAPDFVLQDTEGALRRLSDHAGQVVVLEWFNPDCPFIGDAHGGGVLADAPERWSERGVVWMAVNSNAPGANGTDRGQNRRAAGRWGLTSPVLMDPSGDVGRAYGATVTPHLFVIDAEGALVYTGAPDNAPMGRPSGGAERQAHLEPTLEAVLAGDAPERDRTKAWGCTIKYGS